MQTHHHIHTERDRCTTMHSYMCHTSSLLSPPSPSPSASDVLSQLILFRSGQLNDAGWAAANPPLPSNFPSPFSEQFLACGQVEGGMVLPKLHGTTNTSDKTTLVAWCRQRPTRMWQGAANGRRRLACANAHNVQVYGWMRWKLSEHPTVPTTTRATALECVLSESNPNPRAAFCVSCLMHCCQRPTCSAQRLPKTNRLVSANISTRSCLLQLPAATAEPPSMVILAGGQPASDPLASPLLRGHLWLS